MKNKIILSTVSLVLAAGALVSFSAVGAGDEPVRKIVVFRGGTVNELAKDALVARFGGVKVKNLNLINGTAVLLPPRAVSEVAKNSAVLRVDDDIVIKIIEP